VNRRYRGAAAGEVLLGVDGGNTKSIALVARPDGTVLGWGRSAGSADLHAVGAEATLERLEAAADAALAVANGPVTAAGFSLAGADWPEDFELLDRHLRERWPNVVVANDAIGALRAAIPDGPGVVVVCGTGAATGARGADGRVWHSSFWQLTQGAHELGVAAIEAIVLAELGVGPPTSLTTGVMRAFGEPSIEAVLHRLTGRATKARREQAGLAPVVLDAAEHGDPAAIDIARAHGRKLGLIAVGAARQVGIVDQPFTLALAGGVLRHRGRTLADALLSEVREAAPAITVVQPTLEPAAGALLLAFDAAGIDVTPAVDERLRATMPPSELFDTRATPAG
jgi:N-acetylglucosamine kinase-like BadF-type ATPase